MENFTYMINTDCGRRRRIWVTICYFAFPREKYYTMSTVLQHRLIWLLMKRGEKGIQHTKNTKNIRSKKFYAYERRGFLFCLPLFWPFFFLLLSRRTAKSKHTTQPSRRQRTRKIDRAPTEWKFSMNQSYVCGRRERERIEDGENFSAFSECADLPFAVWVPRRAFHHHRELLRCATANR